MGKCYMVRHQAAGFITSHIFAKPPTDEQMSPIVDEIQRLHGSDGWIKIVETNLLGNEVPEFPKRPTGMIVGVGAVGTVTPPVE